MSHITDASVTTKFDDKKKVISTLNKCCALYKGMTYEESGDGTLIQIYYGDLDNPAKSYHPEGNLRFSKLNDGSWKLSGDPFRCRDLYAEVTDTIEDTYILEGVEEWADINNFTSSTETDENKQKVFVVRRGGY